MYASHLSFIVVLHSRSNERMFFHDKDNSQLLMLYDKVLTEFENNISFKYMLF